ncbi:hypothetical protein KEM54_004957 [Ascosphaera aggregata]|nr:hypothetical protein KEM54_004957 [Ascosphaera aggregata]
MVLQKVLSSLFYLILPSRIISLHPVILDALSSPLAVVIVFVTTHLIVALTLIFKHQRTVPLSVNYHFTRECNKDCGFCFFTAKSSFTLSEDDARRGLRLLREAGTKKINFAGGEPCLNEKFLGSMIVYCKRDLAFESVSVVSNGSLIKKAFFLKYARWLDILAISCDSFNESTNIAIGRGSGHQVDQLYRIAGWCCEFGVKFKINTVVCSLNHQEDMNVHINLLTPFRWKCFQVLTVRGENDSENTLKDARDWCITREEFDKFCERHKAQKCLVPEPNDLMITSYLILDEYMRFLNRQSGEPSQSILDVGVHKALEQVEWDHDAFLKRGGIYDWARKPAHGVRGSTRELDW